MNDKKMQKLTLAQRLKQLFVRAPKTQAHMMPAASAQPQLPHSEEQVAFKAGAAVTFATPIGAYAGNTQANDMIRKRAEQQFLRMDDTHNMTVN